MEGATPEALEQLRRIEATADPYAMQPQTIMEEQESRRELYDGLKRLTQREQTYLLYRYGFTDGKEHPLIGTAIYFHLTKGRAQKTEEQAMDNLWLELPLCFILVKRKGVIVLQVFWKFMCSYTILRNFVDG